MTSQSVFTVRLATVDDLAALCTVQPGIFDYPVDHDLAVEFLADPRHHLALAFVEERIVGMASALHYVHPDKPPQLFINEVGVAPAFQRRGIGRRLVETLCGHGKSLGCSEAWVATEPANIAAKQMYATAGGIEEESPFVMFSFDLG